jgi:hypothetical protein
MDNLSNGLGRAANHFSHITSVVAISWMVLGVIVIGLSFRYLIREYAHLMVFYFMITLGLIVLFFQHQVGHYLQGVFLLVLSIICFIRLRKIYQIDKKNTN